MVPLGAVRGGRGDPLWDPDGLEAGLPGSEVSGDEDLLPNIAVGLGEEAEERAGERGMLAVEGERTAGGVREAERTAGGVREGERTAGGVGERTAGVMREGTVGVVGEEPAEEDRRSGRFWLDERRPFRPSCSPVASFLLSLRM